MFDLSKITGIYCITCTATGRKYVGKTAARGGVGKRWTEHRTVLNKGTSGCIRLQKEWSKYGRGAFTFEVLEPVPGDAPEETYVEREKFWIEELRAELNIAVPGINPMRGRKHSAETRAEMSRVRQGRLMSAETRAKVSATSKGRPKDTTARAKISLGRLAASAKPAKGPPVRKGVWRRSAAGPVERVHPVTGEVTEYSNPSDAKAEGYNINHILECCRGSRGIHKGYLWGFLPMTL